MDTETKTYKGRTSPISTLRHSANALLLFLPAFIFLSGCSAESLGPDTCGQDSIRSKVLVRQTCLTKAGGILHGCTADVFMFNDDVLQRIDAYQRVEIGRDNSLDAASREGRKIAVIICNPQQENYDWNSISSFESISEIYSDLRMEDPERPLMSGVMQVNTDNGPEFSMDVSPLLSEIHVRSIRCDFSGRPYAGSLLENPHIYLANVNSMAAILDSDISGPASPVNTDGYPHESDRCMKHPEMVHVALDTGIGSETVYPAASLYCYPNSSNEDSAGTPFTRLVISGEINGKKYYYPMNINRGEFGYIEGCPGIGRNCRYVFDIVLKKTGVTDPTVPVSGETVSMSGLIRPWDTLPEDMIRF